MQSRVWADIKIISNVNVNTRQILEPTDIQTLSKVTGTGRRHRMSTQEILWQYNIELGNWELQSRMECHEYLSINTNYLITVCQKWRTSYE